MSEEKELNPVVLSGKDVEEIIALLSSIDALMNSTTDGLDASSKMILELVFSPIKLGHMGIVTKLGPEAFMRYSVMQDEITEQVKNRHKEKEEQRKNDTLEALLKILN